MCLSFHHCGPACSGHRENELGKSSLVYARLTLRCIINSERAQRAQAGCAGQAVLAEPGGC